MEDRDLLCRVREMLTAAGCEDADFDARCLLEDIREPEAVLAAAARRAAGEPLQYILGEWDFLTLTLAVGPGVLIPRPDTERLCEVAAEWLAAHALPGDRVLDLCAGTGCVGLGVASLCPVPLQVTAVELSPEAMFYLKKNVARYPRYSVTPVTGDVLREADRFPAGWAAILSNPPYIPTGDLPGLMREVQHEPKMALDGDGDGLRFYRAIAADWAGKLRPGGLCALEVGIGQAEAVAELLKGAGLENIRITDDYAGIPRVVSGERGRTE